MALAVALGGLAACSKGSSGPHARAVVLDGRPRYPDDQGILTAITGESLTVDKHEYRVTENLQSFSASTLAKVSPADRVSQYVQVGVNKKTVVWIALYSAVIKRAGQRPVAFHIGGLVKASKQGLVFADGSVLRVSPTVTLPHDLPASVRVEIDVGRHRVERLTVLSV
jgi:hypothetical protein